MAIQPAVYVRDVACPVCGTLYRLYGPAPGSPVTEIYGYLACEVCGATVAEAPTGGWHLERKTAGSAIAETAPRTLIQDYLVPAVLGGVFGYSVSRCNPTGAAIGAALGIPAYRLACWILSKLTNS